MCAKIKAKVNLHKSSKMSLVSLHNVKPYTYIYMYVFTYILYMLYEEFMES